ncbi:MAG: FAD-dependent oxidoreductase [Elusimicrobiota bacterium]
MRHRVAVIGGGIFGACAALELSRSFDVTLFERRPELFQGATYANHNRHHYGYHYPRSPETALQCLESRASFENLYGDCLDWDFDNYYCVAADDSKTTPEQYLSFCRKVGLPFEEVKPPKDLLDPSKIALCLKAREGVYDIAKLRLIVSARLKAASNLRVLTGREIVAGSVDGAGRKILTVVDGGARSDHAFDFVVNATYGNINRFCGWFGFPERECQFNLQELDVIELPLERRAGVTVQDGPFPSFIPMANTNRYLMAHVVESQLIREISAGRTPLLQRVAYIESNWSGVLKACAEFIPLLRRAVYVKSIFVDRVVDSARLGDDSRVTEIVEHGSGCWSVFSAKVITCVTTAHKLHLALKSAAGLPA